MIHTQDHIGFKPVQTLRWLFFDLNSFFASAEQQENTHLRGKPVAVVPSMTDSTCAIAASYEAKAFGIKTGTKIYEAKRMCPDLHCVLARHDVYVKYHDLVMNEVENHIPITKICSIDEAACRLCDNESSPEEASEIAQNIKQGLRKNVGENILCSIGIAQNPFLAKTASNIQKPDGLVILHPNNYKEHLFQLELSDLTGIGCNIERRLNKAGVHTIEQLWNTAPKQARQIWGSVAGEKFWYKLHGHEIPDGDTQKCVVGHSRVLDPDHRLPEKAFDITQQLTVKAATRLRRYELYARKFRLSVHSMDNRKWARETILPHTQDNFTFIKALKSMWNDMVLDMGRTKLLKVSVTIHDLYKREHVTMDLFEHKDTTALRNNTLSSAIDALNTQYGAQTIGVGLCPKTKAGNVGTKIAFTRIPEQEEF